MLFEIAEEPQENCHHAQQPKNFFDDVSLISSLSLGGGMSDDDESRCELLGNVLIIFLYSIIRATMDI